jgi:cytochrome P450
VQQEDPIARVRLWDGTTPWLVTRYADQRALLADPRISADASHPSYPHEAAGVKAQRTQAHSFINLDDPEHARLRRMVTAPFTIKRVEGMRPALQSIVDHLIDDMLAGPKPVDLVEAFALPLPSLVISELLGVPYEDHAFFQDTTKVMIRRESEPEQVRQAQKQLIDFLDDLVGRKLTEPGDDLLTQVAGRVITGELTRHEAAVMGQLLLLAGHETTGNMIALGTLALLEHPDELAKLRESEDPQTVVRTVEEMLRYLSIVHGGRRRVVLSDIEIGGQTLHAGDGVIFPNDIANRDPEAFPDPDRLDIGRDARHHIAFGYGMHQCLGQPLARVELQVVYSTLYRRIPTLRLATELENVPFRHDAFVYGVYELPVTW